MAREILPAQQSTVVKMRTLETGIQKARSLEEERRQFRAKQGHDPEVSWTHPRDGVIKTILDESLVRAMQGGANGAYNALKADGYPDLARNLLDKNK